MKIIFNFRKFKDLYKACLKYPIFQGGIEAEMVSIGEMAEGVTDADRKLLNLSQ